LVEVFQTAEVRPSSINIISSLVAILFSEVSVSGHNFHSPIDSPMFTMPVGIPPHFHDKLPVLSEQRIARYWRVHIDQIRHLHHHHCTPPFPPSSHLETKHPQVLGCNRCNNDL
jgi:hypothetical protein